LIEEYLDHDLDPQEKQEIEARLNLVANQEEQPELARFARNLLVFIDDEQLYLVPIKPTSLQKLESQFRNLEIRYLGRNQFRTGLKCWLLILGFFAIGSAIISLVIIISPSTNQGFLSLFINRLIVNEDYWIIILHVSQAIVGLAIILGSSQIGRSKERIGVSIVFMALLIYLTVIDLMLFYYYQFSTIISALIQFVMLLALIYYRNRHLTELRIPYK
jgi:hypothetical protein